MAFADGKVCNGNEILILNQLVKLGFAMIVSINFLLVLFHALALNSSNSCELWCKRFGHPNFRTLFSMENAVIGLPTLNQDHEGDAL